MENALKTRVNYKSNSVWEPLRGFSRAVQVGESLYVSGTTAVADSGEVIAEDAYGQTRFAIDQLKNILAKAGFKISDVIRTRMYVTDMGKWAEYARAHRETFDQIRPASSIVQVARLKDPRLLIELEADAVRGCAAPQTVELGAQGQRG